MSGNYPAPTEINITKLVRSIRDLFEGRGNRQGRFTCTLNQATTTVAHPNVGPESEIVFGALHANAAAELANLYVSARVPGQFTVTHSNSATANRTFAYAIAG